MHSSIIHQSTYVGDTTEEGAKNEVEGKIVGVGRGSSLGEEGDLVGYQRRLLTTGKNRPSSLKRQKSREILTLLAFF